MVTRQSDAAGATADPRLLDEIPIATLVVDPSSDRITDANTAAAALVTGSPADLRALPLSRTLVSSGDGDRLQVGDRSVPVHIVGPDDWRNADGPVSIVLIDRVAVSLAHLSDDRLREECLDLRRQLDEARTRQQKLVSVWAHELKTPLTVIQSYLEILTGDLDEGLSEEQLSFLNITKESVLRLRRLVLDLVDLIAFRSGHLSIEAATVEVSSLLDEVIREMRPLADAADVELLLERPAIRVAIRADADRVGQILRNLLDNAFKFTPSGGAVTLRTRVERDWVIIDVADSGVGIPPDDLDRVFDEFVQLRPTRTRRRQRGSGLGLAISRQIAHAHGGLIELESEIGSGSTFSVRLPREHNLDHI